MWRSNALRLRRCSSITHRKHVVSRWYSSQGSLPIRKAEFESALGQVFKWTWTTESRIPIGLAISGGVDSMALAALYTEARLSNGNLPKPHGFIVDHKLRPESTEEAEWVAEQLRSKLEMEATVLTLKWPTIFDAQNLQRFETEARRLRYQALGRACRELKTTMLMVAHHGDDQAETVLMRLANNRLRSGLQAMQRVEWIPECEGIHGVYHSGKQQRHKTNLNIPFPVEQGGIQILRPLLGFEKTQLIATCKERDIEWAEDQTNQIPTTTSRNALRHIYKNHKLPEALSVKSLVTVSQDMQDRVEAYRSYGGKLFDQSLIHLNIQTGSLVVRFPPLDSLLQRPIVTEADKNEAKDNAYCLLERVADLVAPKLKPQLGQISPMIDSIYPELEDEDSPYGTPGMEHFKKSRSVYGVWWRFWDKPSPFKDTDNELGPGRVHPREWLLTRQPLDRLERYGSSHYKINTPLPPTVSLYPPTDTRSREAYSLFDNRFWICLQNHSNDTLTLRVFEKADLKHLPTAKQERDSLRKTDSGFRPHRFISAAFALLNPSDLRFTLPAVFRTDSTTGEESLLGFPTLDVRMDGFGPPEKVCGWKVRYKKIDTGSRALADIVVPGFARVNIIAEEKRQRMDSRGVARLKLPRRAYVEPEIKSNSATGEAQKGKAGEKKTSKSKWAMRGREAEGLSFLEEEGRAGLIRKVRLKDSRR